MNKYAVKLSAHLLEGSITWECDVRAENKMEAEHKANQKFNRFLEGQYSWEFNDNTIADRCAQHQ